MPSMPPLHRPRQAGRHQRKRPSPERRGYDSAWRRRRAAFLARHPRCEVCGAPAQEAHHRLAKVLGGTDDESNLQALCKPCHSRKTATALPTLKRGTGAGDVELVCGPPGAGKTSYVLERMAAGDVVVDVDRLFVALTGLDAYDKPEALLPVVLAARDAVVAAVAAGVGSVRKLWLIAGGATERQRRRVLGPLEDVRVTVLRPTAGECYRRIGKDPRRSRDVHRWRPLIAEWFATYEEPEP